LNRVRAFLKEAIALPVRIVRPAFRSVRDNSGLAVLSVVLAFGTWIIVTDAENPTRTRVLPVDLEVQAVNLEPDVAVANDLQPVRVRIRVEEDVFASLTAADFEATVDLDGLTIGVYEVPVEVRPTTSRGNLRVEEVIPIGPGCPSCTDSEIEVQLEQLVTKRVPVVVTPVGEPPEDYEMSVPEVGDETVNVAGPQDRVEQVTQATGSISVDGRTDTIDQAVRLEPRDSRGNLVTGVSVDPALTDVRVEIDAITYTRAVVVVPHIDRNTLPAPGYNVVGVSVDPVTVTVSGSQQYIEGATTIDTQPISVDGADEDLVKVVSLDLPSGVTVIGNVNVTVTIQVAPSQGRLSLAMPVTVRNLGSGLSVSGALPNVVVTLEGPTPDLLGLTAADVTASVNLDGREAGTHQITVEAAPPPGVEVASISPQSVELTLEEP
jgi:YbbR domain-containing protein